VRRLWAHRIGNVSIHPIPIKTGAQKGAETKHAWTISSLGALDAGPKKGVYNIVSASAWRAFLQRRVEAARLRAVDQDRARGAAAEQDGGSVLGRAGLGIDSARLHVLPHVAAVVGRRCLRMR